MIIWNRSIRTLLKFHYRRVKWVQSNSNKSPNTRTIWNHRVKEKVSKTPKQKEKSLVNMIVRKWKCIKLNSICNSSIIRRWRAVRVWSTTYQLSLPWLNNWEITLIDLIMIIWYIIAMIKLNESNNYDWKINLLHHKGIILGNNSNIGQGHCILRIKDQHSVEVIERLLISSLFK